MKRMQRKSTPKVRDGRVQKKNSWQVGRGYLGEPRVAIDRRKAGRGYRHVVTPHEVDRFLQILPVWDRWGQSLDRIWIDSGSEYLSGWFRRREIGLCAFPCNLEVAFAWCAINRDMDFIKRFDIPFWKIEDEELLEDGFDVVCRFNRATARYYTLMRVLVHELGHHVDRETNKKQWCSRGEEFAENYGRDLEHRMWDDYVREFGDPRVMN